VLSITDLTYENPQGDIGTVTVRIDGDVLFLKGLANFRDDPNHYVSPIVLGPKQTLTVEVKCTAQGKSAPDATCRTALIVAARSPRCRRPDDAAGDAAREELR